MQYCSYAQVQTCTGRLNDFLTHACAIVHKYRIAQVHNCKRGVLHMKIVTVTINKGGVGKTSVAACTARRTAAAGMRTLVLSTEIVIPGLPKAQDPD